MARLGRRTICLWWGLLLALGVQAQTLHIGTWDQKSDTLTAGGEAILAQAYAELKQPVEFVDLPSRRAMLMMLNGELDGNVFRIAGLAAEQPTLYRVDTPIAATEIRVYAVDTKRQVNTWRQLDGLRVAYLRGTLLIERNLPGGTHRVEAGSIVEMLRLLQRNAVDVLVMSDPIHSKPHPLARAAGIVRLEGVLETTPLYHYLRGQHRELGMRLNSVLKRMTTSGEMQEIRGKVAKAFE